MKMVKEKNEQMNHVLFLDFDGPLFPDRYISFHVDNRRPYPGVDMPEDVSYWKMDPLAVEMLNNLQSLFRFTTVISSSWKKHISKEQCVDLFDTNGLFVNLADDWATVTIQDRPWKSCARSSEIAEYVVRHGIKDYIILDDPQSGLSLTGTDHDLAPWRIVLVDPDMGIGSSDYITMLQFIKIWAGL